MSRRRSDATNTRKHKRPKGWGSLCPADIDANRAQALLDSGVTHGGAVYNTDGERCFRALQHHVDADGTELWHGHPIPWTRLPPAAKNKLVEAGRLDVAVFRKAIRQGWGKEGQA